MCGNRVFGMSCGIVYEIPHGHCVQWYRRADFPIPSALYAICESVWVFLPDTLDVWQCLLLTLHRGACETKCLLWLRFGASHHEMSSAATHASGSDASSRGIVATYLWAASATHSCRGSVSIIYFAIRGASETTTFRVRVRYMSRCRCVGEWEVIWGLWSQHDTTNEQCCSGLDHLKGVCCSGCVASVVKSKHKHRQVERVCLWCGEIYSNLVSSYSKSVNCGGVKEISTKTF